METNRNEPAPATSVSALPASAQGSEGAASETPRILITGANRGLGLALVRHYLGSGYRVYASSHGEVSAELAALMSSEGLWVAPLELGDDASVREFTRCLRLETDCLDIILNNAAMLGDTSKRAGDGLDFADALRVYGVNALGPMRMVDSCFDLLMKGPTRIVANVSSEAGSLGKACRDGWYAYGMSKAALNMASITLHRHLRPLGGRVLVIHPGWVRTWMQGHLDSAADLSPEESAEGVARQIEEYRLRAEIPEQPPFLDWKGRFLPW